MGSSDGEVDLTMVLMRFDASDPARLQSVLARYVVLSRGHTGCRNIDLALSATTADRFVVVQKWETPEAQRRPFDSADLVARKSTRLHSRHECAYRLPSSA